MKALCPQCGTEFLSVKAANGRAPRHCSSKCYHREYYARRKGDPEGPWIRQMDRYRSNEAYRAARVEEMREWQHRNRSKITAKRQEPAEKGRQRRWTRDANLRRNYGIGLAEYEQMLEAQGGCCALCGRSDVASKRIEWLCVDHCHSTGKVRKLLCKPCNTGLGCFQDSPTLLAKAITYLNGGSRHFADAVLHRADERDQHGAA